MRKKMNDSHSIQHKRISRSSRNSLNSATAFLALVLILSTSTTTCQAFVPNSCADYYSSTTTALFGVRKLLRHGLARFGKSRPGLSHKTANTVNPFPHEVKLESLRSQQQTALSEPKSMSDSFNERLVIVDERIGDNSSVATLATVATIASTTATIERKILQLPPPPPALLNDDIMTIPLYQLPDLDEEYVKKLFPLELEFRDKLATFCQYTQADLQALSDPRLRVLLQGVAASAGVQPVYRAFEVLYADLYPLRVAGRILHHKVVMAVEQAVQARRDDLQAILAVVPNLEERELMLTRLSFGTAASILNNRKENDAQEDYLTREQLQDLPVIRTVAIDMLGFSSVSEFLDRLQVVSSSSSDSFNPGRWSFRQLVLGLHEIVETDVCGVDDEENMKCHPPAVIAHVIHEIQQQDVWKQAVEMQKESEADFRKLKHCQRYDEMVMAFREWEHLVPTGPGRIQDVVRGCFEGAKHPAIVDALRVAYVDVAPLRVAGDIIFKLCSSMMNGRQKQNA